LLRSSSLDSRSLSLALHRRPTRRRPEAPRFMRGAFSLGLTSINSEIASSRSRGSPQKEGPAPQIDEPHSHGSPLEYLTPNEEVTGSNPVGSTFSPCPGPRKLHSSSPARGGLGDPGATGASTWVAANHTMTTSQCVRCQGRSHGLALAGSTFGEACDVLPEVGFQGLRRTRFGSIRVARRWRVGRPGCRRER